MRNGHVYQQVLWVPAINATAGGLLPTPQSRDWRNASKPGSARMQRKMEQRWSPSLEESLLMLPTSTTITHKQNSNSTDSSGVPLLQMAVEIAMLPTPTTRDWKDGSQQACQNVEANGLLGREIHQAAGSTPTGDAIYLNPSLVEEMMGFPLGWTA